MPEVTTSDGVRLHHTDQGSGPPVVLLHGWTFSGRFFDGVVPGLVEHARVLTVDLRGHGESGKPEHGYRICRLAKDLHDLLEQLDLQDVTVAGWSLGCPVTWSYDELFGSHRLARAVFIEQTPRQYIGLDWPWHHAQWFDDAALARLCVQVEADPAGQDAQQLDTITATGPTPAQRELLLAEMAKCPPRVRTAVMTEHTRRDWCDLLPTLDLPTLVCVARQDTVFDWRGPAWVGEHVPGAQTAFFEDSSHALFLDEPVRFVEVLTRFLAG